MRAVFGTVAPGFEAVKATFEENFAKRGEWGAAFCVHHQGRKVVDLWGGQSDRISASPWQPDTLAVVFSSTKGLTAMCFMILADRGILDYDARVADYWPTFAKGAKADITVRTLLNHRSGLLGLDRPVTLDMLEHHPEQLTELLEAQQPVWRPGISQGYHAITFGLYAAELFRRITGESLGRFFAREVADKLGADAYIGLPESLEPRVATNYPASPKEGLLGILPKLLIDGKFNGRVYRQMLVGGHTAFAFAHPRELGPLGMPNYNTPRVHRLELPWGGGIASARGLALVYAALGGDHEVKLVSKDAIEPVKRRQSWSELDAVLRKPIGWSQGFLKETRDLFSPNPESFGHAGAGGSLGWYDPTQRLAIGYVMNKMDHRIRSKRAVALCRALYRCL